MLNIKIRALIQACLIACADTLFAKCSLPVPDMETKVPKRNAAGYFLEVKNNNLFLYNIDERKIAIIDVEGVEVAYSAAGGDISIFTLRKGVQLRIWYVGCRAPRNGLPKAAYVEFFSNDPFDYPDNMYLKKGGR
ncbi:hypothetical protein PSQ39_12410 [Curvibacter sp. HBC28]|uniref:Uncharacterized protein n=1 Tax=Curvibacter microcysteis TaxID=3026419 RepID=A0ABT5MHS6_9BURK|nr:hypothetical protein [Curvibacter sp. HBC28]MDD0815432.1 hypothetical protein [Curvibacter sp. HBC28]